MNDRINLMAERPGASLGFTFSTSVITEDRRRGPLVPDSVIEEEEKK